MLNCVTLMGRLTADPVLKVTPAGKDVCSFSIAVDKTVKGERKADFIPIVVWGSSAKFVCDYFRKGSMIAIQGSIQTGTYTDNEGYKRNTFEVRAKEVSFCERKNPSTANNSPSLSGAADTAPSATGGYYATATAADFEEIGCDEDDY